MPLSILCGIPFLSVLLSYGLFRATKLPPIDSEHFTAFIKELSIGGHRGLMALAPESTVAGMRKAKAFGADWVDLDMQNTADGVPIVFNGCDLSRTTNGSGPVSAYTLAELKLLNAADKFHDKEQFPYAAIPTVVEAIQECIELDVKIAIEVKYHEDKFRKQHPQIIAGHAWRPNYFACLDSSCARPRYPNYVWRQLAANVLDVCWTWVVHYLLFRITGASLLWVDHDSVTRQYVDAWKNQQIQVIAFTVNDVYEKRYLLHTLQCPFVTDDCSDIRTQTLQRLKYDRSSGVI